MKKAKWLCTAAAVLALSVAVAGCGGSDDKKAADSKGGPKGDVMVYTSIYPDIIDKMCKPNVAKAFPDMKVTWFQGGTEKVITKITGEIKANKIGTDVLMVADPSYYLTLQDQGLLLDYVSPNLKDVITDKDKNGAWSSVRVCNMIIAYNSDKLKPEDAPKSWKDLTDPKWKDKLAMANPLLSGSILTVAADLSKRYGWDYFKALKANGIKIEGGNTAVQNKLITGEYFVGIIGEENILKVSAKGEPLKVAYATDGAVILPSPIAIFASTQNPEAAKAVTDWWLSKEGQQAIVTKGWMHSVRDDVPPPKGAPDKAVITKNSPMLDWAKFAKEAETIKETFRKLVIEK